MAPSIRKSVSTQMLKASTRKFLGLHWSEDLLGTIPQWVRLDETKVSESVRRGGCYAILDKIGNVSYVGLGIAKPLKEGAAGGVLGRLHRHVLVRGALSRGELKPKRDVWNGMSGILYIPFPKYEYLAAALEIYLIDKLGDALSINKSRVRRDLAKAVDTLD